MGTLANKTVAITRAFSQTQEMIHAIQRFGGIASCYPLLEIHLRSDDPVLRMAILMPVDLIVFTSVNGVRAYLDARVREEHCGASPSVVCVGAKTAEAAVTAGLTVVGIPPHFAAQYLVDLICERHFEGRRILLVRGNLADPQLTADLQALQCEVIDCVGYDTMPGPDAKRLWADIAKGKIDAVTFLSGSAVEVFVAERPKGSNLNHLILAAVGPKTQHVLLKFGLPCHVVADDATGADLVDALANYFAQAPDF